MYEFYYGFVKKECENPILLSTDTDSFIFESKENFYEIMCQNKEFFELSNFPKDEYGGTAIYKFTGTKSKMYSILDVNNWEKSVYKGHNSNIGHNEFLDVHSNKRVIRHIMKGIKPFNHKMYTCESNKTSLSAYDDKRYILDDRINTLPYGHKDIIKN